MAQFYEGREVLVGVALETTFKTRIVDAGTFTVIKGEPHEINPDVKVHEVPGATGGKSPVYDHTISTIAGSTPRVPIAGPLSIFEIDMFLAATFQEVTEAASTPFTKIFKPFTGLQPDFTTATLGTGAWALTYVKGFPVADTSWALTSCIGESMKISAERDSYVKFECGLVSLEPAEFDSDAHADATWERGLDGPGGADAAAEFYGMKFTGNITAATLDYNDAGPAAIALQSFTLEYTQEVTGESPDGSGGYLNYGIKNRAGTGEIVLLKDAQVEAALANWIANGYVKFIIRWGAAGAAVDGEMQITATGKITDVKFDESGILGATITFNLAAPDNDSDMIEVRLSNDIERSWPAPA
jgi:hypothetical protein